MFSNMNFTAIFDAYTNQVASVHAYLSTIRREADREFERLVGQKARQKEHNLPEDQIVSMGNHAFRTASAGEHFFYDFRDYTIDSQMESLVSRTNRQYQWLLVEAYELFEDFLEHAYAAAAMSNKDLWPLRDYGPITVEALDTVTFEFLLEQARAKKDKPQSLLNPLRNRLPLLRRFETENALKIDLWFAINLVEKLRHHIVHTKGLISSKADFVVQLHKKCGTYNNGRPDRGHQDLIDDYIRPTGGIHHVRLLDVSLRDKGSAHHYVSMFDQLSNYLLAYAHLLASSFERLESKRPAAQDATDA